MKFPFPFKKGEHDCEAAVIFCVDFRFWRETLNFLQEELKLDSFDLWTTPGCAKGILDEASGQIIKEKIKAVSAGLHHIKKIILVNHADCGAYGGRQAFPSIEEEKQTHLQDLTKAREMLQVELLDLEIVAAYADLDPEQKEVEISVV